MAEQKDSAPSVRISYFGFQGRGAALRAAAAIGGISYEDNFVGFDEHKEAKKSGTRRWNGLPELTIFDKDGKEIVTIGQSNACLRYIGKLGGLYSDNPVYGGLIDEVIDSVEDVTSMFSESFREKDADKKKAMRLELLKADKVPYWIAKFESRYEENEKRGNKNGYIVGDSLTIADIKVFCLVGMIQSGKVDHMDYDKVFGNAKRTTSAFDKLANNDAMKKYLTEFEVQQKDNKENKTKSFKKGGKDSYGSY